MSERSNIVATAVRATPLRVHIPDSAIGGTYTPEEVERIAETLMKAAKYARMGSYAREFTVWRPMGELDEAPR